MAAKVLQVAAIRLEHLINEREGVTNDVIPLRGLNLSLLEANSRTNTMQAEQEGPDARVEILL